MAFSFSDVPDADAPLRGEVVLKHTVGVGPREGFGPSRTWIGNVRIERLMEMLQRGPSGDQVRRTRASGEETHVAILFERLTVAFSRTSGRRGKKIAVRASGLLHPGDANVCPAGRA